MSDDPGAAEPMVEARTPSAPSSGCLPGKALDEAAAPIVQEAPDAVPPKEKPKRQVTLLPSVFEGRPPVLLFAYTAACGAKPRPMDRAVLADIDGPRLFYSHTEAVHEYNAVINILRQGGLYRVRADGQKWSLLWSSHPSPETLRQFRPVQRTNHFPGSWHLGRKDLIWRNISRMQRRFGRLYQITPQGYVLPKAFLAWEGARTRCPTALWIWKPCSQSCGRGIKVFSSHLTQDEAQELGRKRGIIQRYIPNPLLIDGYKFDLRIYVVVLSFDPLKVYINDEGLVRLATEKFSAAPETLDSRTMHLTNYSVNKSSPAFVQNRDGTGGNKENGACAEERPPSKWSLAELRTHFERHELNYGAMFDRIKDLVIKTLIAVEGPMQDTWCKALEEEDRGWAARGPGGVHRASCFEMYGFDVLVDDELKPWLLEVNICPSLSSGSPLDKRIKTKFVADTFTLVGVRPPPALWRRTNGSVKRTSSDVIGTARDDREYVGCTLPPDVLAKRAARLAAAESPADALALFDETDWEMVLDSHDEDMRSGGLERIFPTADASHYTPYFTEESYCNLVLRKWHEAGGGELFKPTGARNILPPWVPRQVCFSRT